MSKILDFSELIVTKICHDLSAPVGAINNGVEFLDDNPSKDMRDKAMHLIEENAKTAVAKIKFFRYLLGKADAMGESDIREVQTLLAGYIDKNKIKIIWLNEHKGENFIQLTNRTAKLTLALAIIQAELLLHGGEIEIQLSKIENGKKIRLKASGEKLKQNDEIARIFKDQELTDIKVTNILIYLASKLCAELQSIIKMDYRENELEFEVEIT